MVAGKHFLFGSGSPQRWGRPIGDEQIGPKQKKENCEKDQPENHLRAEHRSPHISAVERVEPEVVGVEAGDPAKRQGNDNEDSDENRHHDATSSAETGLPTRHFFSSTHETRTLPAEFGVSGSDLRWQLRPPRAGRYSRVPWAGGVLPSGRVSRR